MYTAVLHGDPPEAYLCHITRSYASLVECLVKLSSSSYPCGINRPASRKRRSRRSHASNNHVRHLHWVFKCTPWLAVGIRKPMSSVDVWCIQAASTTRLNRIRGTFLKEDLCRILTFVASRQCCGKPVMGMGRSNIESFGHKRRQLTPLVCQKRAPEHCDLRVLTIALKRRDKLG